MLTLIGLFSWFFFSGLQLNLQKFPLHFHLFKCLPKQKEPPTDEEISIAAGQKKLNEATFKWLVRSIDQVDGNIADAFN